MFKNEDGTYWQGKPQNPRVFDGKVNKYEAIMGGGSRAFLPPIPAEIRQKISKRYGVEVPLDSSFWDWVASHPEIPITPTEGGKKTLALLSLGIVAIGFFGVNGGYGTKDRLNNPIQPQLIADIARFATPGRKISLAFDQDSEQKTRRRVSGALYRFGGLLIKAGAAVDIVEWNGAKGKGADDFIVNCGAAEWESIVSQRLSFDHWKISQQLNNRLTIPADLRLTSSDLSTLESTNIPEEGIIAIASAKATGKTKLIGSMVKGVDKVLSAGHRVALGRNLCTRLGLNWRGDLDKVKGDFINGSGYTLRVGFCVDSLLAIDVEKFRGCDLVIDEAVQVVRHILSSSTCAKDGKRPVLLARFQELLQVARRVIIADADLEDSTVHYFSELRGDGCKPFLIHNDFQSGGYDCRFIQSDDRSAIVADLLDAVDCLQEGEVIFVATDALAASKTVGASIVKKFPGKRILVINSKTSSGQAEREFIETPDTVLLRNEYDVIIGSPSLATGISSELQGVFVRVYGIFTGGSSTDADISQSLSRVREPVPRVVWVNERGSSFSKVSSSTNPLELKSQLRDSTAATISLQRSSLRPDSVEGYDWQCNPHVHMWARIEADRNRAMWNLRDAVLVRLRNEGNRVKVEFSEKDKAIAEFLSGVSTELKLVDAEEIVSADSITLTEVLKLDGKEVKTPQELHSISKFWFCEFYRIEPELLTVEDVLADKQGRRRVQLLSLEQQLDPGTAADRTVKSIENQLKWNAGLCPWDVSHASLRQTFRKKLGLEKFLDPSFEWTEDSPEVKECADLLWQYKSSVKTILHFSVGIRKPENPLDGKNYMSDLQAIHQLLFQLGVVVKGRQLPRQNGKRRRSYRLNLECWQESMTVLNRRLKHRQELAAISGELNTMQQLNESLIADCASMATAAAESEDRETIRATLGILYESLLEQPETKKEVWNRLTLEHRKRLQEAIAA
jgi:hypothetical protein